MHEASQGYALNVYINDEKANSRYSIPALRQCSNFIERRTSCATVFIDHKAVNLQPKTFLQGAAISSSLTSAIYTYGSHLPTVIVHFDDSVPARMPDRDCLIDDSDVVSEIRALFNETMVEMVDSDLSTMSEEAFLAIMTLTDVTTSMKQFMKVYSRSLTSKILRWWRCQNVTASMMTKTCSHCMR